MILINKQEWHNISFLFNPKSEESIKYAKVCAEDLADALREAEQYEQIK